MCFHITIIPKSSERFQKFQFKCSTVESLKIKVNCLKISRLAISLNVSLIFVLFNPWAAEPCPRAVNLQTFRAFWRISFLHVSQPTHVNHVVIYPLNIFTFIVDYHSHQFSLSPRSQSDRTNALHPLHSPTLLQVSFKACKWSMV